ncbi:MAG: sodium:solute symporter [Mariniblastus sp.]|nr:sodium:solute symporter [Mariniblastus sp.]
MLSYRFWFCLIWMLQPVVCAVAQPDEELSSALRDRSGSERILFEALPDLPDAFGVAGPVVGVHHDVLIAAGGANFAAATDPDLWEKPKQYHEKIYLLRPNEQSPNGFSWEMDESVRLPLKIGYSSVVSTEYGVLSIGGENSEGPQSAVFLIQVVQDSVRDGQPVVVVNDRGVPDLPVAATAGGAAVIGDFVYAVAGKIQRDDGTWGASQRVWRMRLDVLAGAPNLAMNDRSDLWEPVAPWPAEGGERMFSLVASQHDGFHDRLYVIGGRRFKEGANTADLSQLEFLTDAWSFDPSLFEASQIDPVTGRYSGAECWRRLTDAPVPMSAGTMVPIGPSHLLVPAYASGDVLADQLKSGVEMATFDHPGFPRQSYLYHTLTNTWVPFGESPLGQVTTPAVRWGDAVFLVSGEIRPRVRTRKAWRISTLQKRHAFGWVNMGVVVVYLLGMVLIGAYVTARNRTTEDYFRGGKSIPWWAAGCSIFATMLSSITYMAVPAKAFAQNWVYAFGSGMILLVAPIAVYIALPFFRRIDATSAYEYLERRFNRTARMIGSASFSLFHVFRMGIVLALAALALASVTPLTPGQCVLVMGALSIIYCTLGGIEAVIWTDTIQTVVLFVGALACLLFAWWGAADGSFVAALDAGKFHWLNWDWGADSFMMMAVWVVVLGGLGQNVASYTADQAVVQRYMTTKTTKEAARSIWLNGALAVPAAVIFFGMGTAFWMFYRTHPEQLDPSMSTDRIMPLFISLELPVGLAGLVVAGIFAAAQSTVSTSMNSGATTLVTDFIKPLNWVSSDRSLLWLARLFTLAMGLLGTWAGLLFVDPGIKSLFDQFIGVLGMFLGVLAGLFALGATTRRANSIGSLSGALVSISLMVVIAFAANDKTFLGLNPKSWFQALGSDLYRVNGYLYAFVGIVVCYVVGYFVSWLVPDEKCDLCGLTLWDPPRQPEDN